VLNQSLPPEAPPHEQDHRSSAKGLCANAPLPLVDTMKSGQNKLRYINDGGPLPI